MSIIRLGLLGLGIGALIIGGGCGKRGADSGADAGSTTATATPGLKGSLDIDGSSTVFPIVQIMGEEFGDANKEVKVATNKSGTGSGFTKFTAGEITICTASRPVKEDEEAKLAAKKIEFVEIPIAIDAVSVVVSPQNTWLKDASPALLRKLFLEGSMVKLWADIKPGYPPEKITFTGPTDNHGTYEYFQEAILGKKKNFRADYQANQDYNAIVQAVSGDKNAIGYVGYNYYAENKEKVQALTIDGVAPSDETAADGTYKPLSRPLFLYVAKSALARPDVKAFLDYALSPQGQAAVQEARYVPLPADAITAVKARIAAGTVGSAFRTAEPGQSIAQVLAAPAAPATPVKK